MNKNIVKTERRNRIHRRVRAKVQGTAERPRLSAFKSNKHVTLQLIDDLKEQTILGMSTNTKGVADLVNGKSPSEAAGIVGQEIAKAAKDQGITKVVFDRGGFVYHGVIKAAAEGAREGGLQF
ncbi:MAG: 50S ribosomal protein L18 [Balneolaceae bacterium]|nr:50S ribosomal protein L18 [Balneolaceae bacterium]